MTGHTLAGENAARVLTVTDRTRGTGRHGVTVGRAVGREVVTLDTALETLTDGRAGHVDLLTFREHFGLEGHAGLEFGNLFSFDMELFEHAASFNASLSKMASKGLAHARGLLGAERDLDCIVAVGFNRLHHSDTVVRHIEHSHGNGHAVFRENARHADLATDDAELITHCFLHPGCDWPGPFS